MNWSCAVTVKLKAVLMTTETGAATAKCVVAAGLTAIVLEVPVIEAVTVSVAVMVRFPAVFKVATNVPAPLVSVELAGNTAAPSVLVKCTMPA